MERPKIKLALLIIAVASTAYWAQPPYLWGGPMLAISSLVWALLTLAAFRSSPAEDWAYRLSSFLGVAMATMEGVAGFLALTTRSGLLVMAVFHVAAFFLALAGRFQKVASRRGGRQL